MTTNRCCGGGLLGVRGTSRVRVWSLYVAVTGARGGRPPALTDLNGSSIAPCSNGAGDCMSRLRIEVTRREPGHSGALQNGRVGCVKIVPTP
jgi:hypothetical protein